MTSIFFFDALPFIAKVVFCISLYVAARCFDRKSRTAVCPIDTRKD